MSPTPHPPLTAVLHGLFVRHAHVLQILSWLVAGFSLAFLVPLGWSLLGGLQQADVWLHGFLLTLGAGLLLWLATRRHRAELSVKDGFLLVNLVWTVLPAFAAVPLLEAIPGISWTDAYFEAELQIDFTQTATATVTRFELCGALPVNSCEDNGGGVYLPDELGVDTTTSFTLPVTFDDQLHVVLGGFAGWEAPGFATGNGLDLAELLTALDADYQVAIMQPYLAGATQDEITATLTAAPAHGFSAPAGEAAGALVYTHNGSPPLLFQGLLNYESPETSRGSDIVGRIALVVSGGRLTINLYAGFYS